MKILGKDCGCAKRRAKIKAAAIAIKQGFSTARASYRRQTGKPRTIELTKRPRQSASIVRVR